MVGEVVGAGQALRVPEGEVIAFGGAPLERLRGGGRRAEQRRANSDGQQSDKQYRERSETGVSHRLSLDAQLNCAAERGRRER